MTLVEVAFSCLKVTPDQWLLDSGCNHHMTGEKKNLSRFKEINGGHVKFGGGACGKVIGKWIMNVDGLPPIKNVWLVSGLEVNLISIRDWRFLFQNKSAT
jgi:hypothetical protein